MQKYYLLRLMASGELADFSESHCAVIGHSAKLVVAMLYQLWELFTSGVCLLKPVYFRLLRRFHL
ncbi:hypothetical protein TI10_15805 [Photorhabdus luminescens subsp. luminescens]|nr:hypothetical protein TI10_15805 [Photorhabdus luminescens subsp. luminescens]